jgi:hypothetical protein
MLNESNYGETDMAMNNGRFHGDANLLVKFLMKPKINTAKSKEAGRPIYEEAPHIEIMQPGNKDSIIKRPASEMDKKRFAEHYRKFEAREDQESVEGTLLDEWAGITRSQCEELKYLNIRTVEQLSAVSDSNSQNIMGINHLKEKANRYLEETAGDATKEALADLQAKFDALEAKMNEVATAPDVKPKRKRRSKAEMDAARAGMSIDLDSTKEITEEVPPAAA